MARSSNSKLQAARRARKGGSSSFALWLIGGSILIVAIAVGLILLNNRTPSTSIATPDVPATWVDRTNLGNPEAKVTLQAWEDFLCPHCARWNSEIQTQLFADYIKPGKVRLEFHQFPLTSHEPGASMSALSSECAADQNAFWPYHDKLFAAQAQDQAGYTMEKLTQYATDLHLDVKKFTQCMNSLQHQTAVTASLNQAIALGLNSTPSVLINGKKMAEPFTYAALKTEIDTLLK